MSAAACLGNDRGVLQSAIPGVPQEYGLKGSLFVDAGTVFGITDRRHSRTDRADRQQERAAFIGRRRPDLGLAVRAATVDYAVPLSKAAYEVVQPLRFGAKSVLGGVTRVA